jgi:hypothetical protein
MSKDRNRGNREAKKPKAAKPPKVIATASPRPEPFASIRPPKDSHK